jgi:hypothetical protein
MITQNTTLPIIPADTSGDRPYTFAGRDTHGRELYPVTIWAPSRALAAAAYRAAMRGQGIELMEGATL